MYKAEYPRLFFAPFLLLTVLCSTFLQSLPLQAASTVSSGTSQMSLPPSEILARARAWTTALPIPVPYNMHAYYQGYRTDCSGFVTMAWGLPPNLPNGGLFTGNDPNNPHQPNSLSSIADPLGKALDDTGKPILSTMRSLQPGDILLNQGAQAHVILFVGWIDIAAKKVVNTPTVDKNNGNYYYDGIEENGDAGAIEHTPDHPLNSTPFDYRQPWPYPYYPGHDSAGYYAWRFDAAKAAKLGYETIKPSGEWVPPSPKDGTIITDNTLYLAATAYPTQKGDPSIATVFFTIRLGESGNWLTVCTVNKPTRSGSVYDCTVHIKQLTKITGVIQPFTATFNVVDTQGNVALDPNGDRNFAYTPSISQVLQTKTNPYPPYTGQLVLDDPLNHNDGQWPSDAPGGFCVFQNGKYILTAREHDGGNAICPGGQKITGDFTFQVETTFVYQSYIHPSPNDDGAEGIDFSSNDNGISDYFRCFINQQGVLSLEFKRPSSPFFDSVTRKISGFKKDQPNLLAAVVVGEQVTVYINLVKELTVTIPDLGQGHITLEVDFGTYSYFPSAAFENAKLWM